MVGNGEHGMRPTCYMPRCCVVDTTRVIDMTLARRRVLGTVVGGLRQVRLRSDVTVARLVFTCDRVSRMPQVDRYARRLVPTATSTSLVRQTGPPSRSNSVKEYFAQ